MIKFNVDVLREKLTGPVSVELINFVPSVSSLLLFTTNDNLKRFRSKIIFHRNKTLSTIDLHRRFKRKSGFSMNNTVQIWSLGCQTGVYGSLFKKKLLDLVSTTFPPFFRSIQATSKRQIHNISPYDVCISKIELEKTIATFEMNRSHSSLIKFPFEQDLLD